MTGGGNIARSMTRRHAIALSASVCLVPGKLFVAKRASAQAGEEKVFDLAVSGGRLPEAVHRIRVTKGDMVRLRWRVDKQTVLHLHGYDIEKKAVPGSVTEFAFEAHATGRFPVNVHHHGSSHHGEPLLVLEVYPR